MWPWQCLLMVWIYFVNSIYFHYGFTYCSVLTGKPRENERFLWGIWLDSSIVRANRFLALHVRTDRINLRRNESQQLIWFCVPNWSFKLGWCWNIEPTGTDISVIPFKLTIWCQLMVIQLLQAFESTLYYSLFLSSRISQYLHEASWVILDQGLRIGPPIISLFWCVIGKYSISISSQRLFHAEYRSRARFYVYEHGNCSTNGHLFYLLM